MRLPGLALQRIKVLSQSITESVNDLTALLEVILDISRIDAGLIRPVVTSFPINRLFFNLHKTFANAAYNKSLRFRLRNSDLLVRSDAILLERILTNLVSNAVKYTERGGLLVAARRVGRHSVRIEVWDTGVGIPADSLHEVFLEYYQIGNVSRADDEGLGLGLSIVKGLCDTLGYPLSARSRHTRGSVFTVTVPRAWHVSAAEHAAAPRPDQEGNARLLLLDDDKRVLGATQQLLGSRGYETRIAESRDEALAILDRGYRPEVVVCDYRLGDGMNGTTVLDEIRDRFGADIVGILITADTDPQRLIDARDSGYRLLHKPLSATALRNTLAMLHAGDSADAGSRDQAQPAWRRARR
ncbi:MAG: hybrid sensor histidine kinase/response regulator, partial [Pseudomonadota bacterium]